MEILFFFLAIVVFFLVTLFIWNSFQQKKGNVEKNEDTLHTPENGGCCGQHAVCEKGSLINNFIQEVEYFDDEELDIYIGKPSNEYTEEMTGQFRDIFYSMHDEDKPKWIRSLQQRGIAIPDQLKDEIILVINDLRSSK